MIPEAAVAVPDDIRDWKEYGPEEAWAVLEANHVRLQARPMTSDDACTSTRADHGTLRCADCGYPVRWNLGDWTHEWPAAR